MYKIGNKCTEKIYHSKIPKLNTKHPKGKGVPHNNNQTETFPRVCRKGKENNCRTATWGILN